MKLRKGSPADLAARSHSGDVEAGQRVHRNAVTSEDMDLLLQLAHEGGDVGHLAAGGERRDHVLDRRQRRSERAVAERLRPIRVRPSFVSTRTSSVSSAVQGWPPDCAPAAPWENGIRKGIALTRSILIGVSSMLMRPDPIETVRCRLIDSVRIAVKICGRKNAALKLLRDVIDRLRAIAAQYLIGIDL